MLNEPLLSVIRENQHEFIAYWMNEVASGLPDGYDEIELYQKGKAYFCYVTDLDIAAELHPLIQSAAGWRCHADSKEIEYYKLLYNPHIWRRSLFEAGECNLTIGLVKQFFYRIDYFEIEVYRCLWEQQEEWTEEKVTAFDEQLHQDRINLIGKMAASMAHEIRNPLTSIKGFLKLLRVGIRNKSLEKSETYLDFIEHECDNIHMQVTGFLSFSKKPIMDEELKSISVKTMIDHNVSLLNPRLINENVDLTLSIPGETKLKVQKLAIQQVLSNLLNNGIDAVSDMKSEKKMSICCCEDANHVFIQVSNNGPRIPVQLARTLFTPFVTSKENGTGLGLAICKQIMSRNNGDISFTSNDLETTFLLTFYKNAPTPHSS